MSSSPDTGTSARPVAAKAKEGARVNAPRLGVPVPFPPRLRYTLLVASFGGKMGGALRLFSFTGPDMTIGPSLRAR